MMTASAEPDGEELVNNMMELRDLILRGESDLQAISKEDREVALHNLEMDIKRLEEDEEQ